MLTIVNDDPSLTFVNRSEGHRYLSESSQKKISRSFSSPTTFYLYIRQHSVKLHVIFFQKKIVFMSISRSCFLLHVCFCFLPGSCFLTIIVFVHKCSYIFFFLLQIPCIHSCFSLYSQGFQRKKAFLLFQNIKSLKITLFNLTLMFSNCGRMFS